MSRSRLSAAWSSAVRPCSAQAAPCSSTRRQAVPAVCWAAAASARARLARRRVLHAMRAASSGGLRFLEGTRLLLGKAVVDPRSTAASAGAGPLLEAALATRARHARPDPLAFAHLVQLQLRRDGRTEASEDWFRHKSEPALLFAAPEATTGRAVDLGVEHGLFVTSTLAGIPRLRLPSAGEG